MPFTGILGNGDSQPGNIILGSFSVSGSTAFAQAQVLIAAAVQIVVGQAQAYILPVKFAQAQADIRSVSWGFAQAQVYILPVVWGQAQADIKQTYPLRWGRDFAHDQTPTAVFTGRPGTDSRYPAPFTSVANATDNDLNTASSTNSTFFFVSTLINYLRFDLGTATQLGDVTVKYARFGGNYGASTNPITIVYADSLGGTDGNGNDTTSWTVATTYTPVESFGATTTVTITNPTFSAHRYWAVGFSQTNIPTASNTTGWSVYDINWLVGGTDKGTFSQAQAKINSFNVNKFAQAQAKVQGRKYGQAQADIKVVQQQYAQAQVQIITGQAFAQAQALIIGQVYAQAQADIKATSQGYAQAQAQITVNFALGQALALIYTTVNQFAQAQAKLNTYDNPVCGQAQADIKTTYQAYAQAAVVIYVAAYGNAQADILATINDCAQAQAKIIYKRTVWAQAQVKVYRAGWGSAMADIKAKSTKYGQANARIVTTYQTFGQANSRIYLIRQVSGFAQTYIKFDEISLPFEDTYTRTTNRGLGSTYYLWYALSSSFTHPAETTYYLNGSSIVLPPTVTSDGYLIGATQLPPKTIITVDIKFGDATGEYISILNSGTNPGKFVITHGPGVLLFNEPTGPSTAVTTPVDTGITYRFVATMLLDEVTLEIRDAADDSVFDSVSYTGPDTIDAVTDHVQFNFTSAVDVTTTIERLEIEEVVERGFAQAQARLIAFDVNRFGQANALMRSRFGLAQALADITNTRFTRNTFGQAHSWIKVYDFTRSAQALTYVGHFKSATAQALIDRPIRYAQAQALMLKHHWIFAYAQASISQTFKSGQAKVYIYINTATVTQNYALVNADIVGYSNASGQAQAKVKRTIEYAQAQGYIYQPQMGKLVVYNKYVLPGFLQNEVMTSTENLFLAAGVHENFTEYIGRENKNLQISMLVVDETYQAAKEQVETATTMLRSSRSGFSKLTIINPDKYYLAKTVSVTLQQTAGAREKAALYAIEFNCQPWLFGSTHSMVTNDTDTEGRTFRSGTWTPARITLTGTDITVSGYTPESVFTGFISISGYVENLVIDHETDVSSQVSNLDYQLFVAPGRTIFEINGATSYIIEWQDRWEL